MPCRKLVGGAFFLFLVFLPTLNAPKEFVGPTDVEVPSCQGTSRKLSAIREQILSYNVDKEDAELLSELILKYSEEFIPGFNPALICSHFFVESSFRTDTINTRDPSYGLGQIMLPTAKRIAKALGIKFPRSRRAQIRFLLDPENNIRFSLYYLKKCREKIAKRELPRPLTDMLAIASYNGNPTFRSKHLTRVRQILRGKR